MSVSKHVRCYVDWWFVGTDRCGRWSSRALARYTGRWCRGFGLKSLELHHISRASAGATSWVLGWNRFRLIYRVLYEASVVDTSVVRTIDRVDAKVNRSYTSLDPQVPGLHTLYINLLSPHGGRARLHVLSEISIKKERVCEN